MNDDPSGRGAGTGPVEGGDGRDEQLAALLAVAPLEEHTRARLVRRALDETSVPSTPARRPARWLGAAAAVLVLVGTGALVLTGGGGGRTARVSERARPNPVAGPPAGVPAPGATAQAVPRDLGPVGDITGAARLRQVLARPAGTAAGSLAVIRQACGPAGPVAGLTGFDTVGTGVDAGQPAAILVGRDPRGRRVAVVVALPGCTRLQRLPLG